MKKQVWRLLLPLMLSGCASIVGSNEETVYIDSTPPHAYYSIIDRDGLIIATGTTPQSVIIKKSDGSYFGKRDYTLTLKQQGYYSVMMPLEYRFSHWYTFGNIIFGVLGWWIVDPFSGGMYTLKEERVQAILRPCPPGPFNMMCS
ncbi:hypothetical protein GJV04_17280 [Enterobacteriaceae bacterium RIT714]|nr:hypothetical protein [Enterobacteriaceae bacterium RIT714]